jgi:hypothetical protein
MRTNALLATFAFLLLAKAQAEEKPSPILTAGSSTTISGYVNTSAIWNPGTSMPAPTPTAHVVRFDDLCSKLRQAGLEQRTSMGRYVFYRFGRPVLCLCRTSPLANRFQIQVARRFLNGTMP